MDAHLACNLRQQDPVVHTSTAVAHRWEVTFHGMVSRWVGLWDDICAMSAGGGSAEARHNIAHGGILQASPTPR